MDKLNVFSSTAERKISIANFNYYEKSSIHPDRVMSEHDIVYIQEGSWEIYQDEQKYFLEKDDLIILFGGRHHYGKSGCEKGTKTMFIHMEKLGDENYIDWNTSNKYNENINFTEYRNMDAFDNKILLPTVIRCKNSSKVISLFKDMIHVFWSALPKKHIKLNALVNLFLFELSIISADNPDLNDDLVSDAIKLISLSGDRMYKLNGLSKMLHISSRTLTERFKKSTGTTIHNYQIDLKLEMARAVIEREPYRGLKEVSTGLGFYDEFHFSKLFKKKFGFSPSQLKPKKND